MATEIASAYIALYTKMPSATTLILGSTIRTYDLDDPWLPDGWTDQRLIGISGGVGEEITLTVQGAR